MKFEIKDSIVPSLTEFLQRPRLPSSSVTPSLPPPFIIYPFAFHHIMHLLSSQCCSLPLLACVSEQGTSFISTPIFPSVPGVDGRRGSVLRCPAPMSPRRSKTLAARPRQRGCGEGMGLSPAGARHGQGGLGEVPALPALRPQPPLLVDVHQCIRCFCLDQRLPE